MRTSGEICLPAFGILLPSAIPETAAQASKVSQNDAEESSSFEYWGSWKGDFLDHKLDGDKEPHKQLAPKAKSAPAKLLQATPTIRAKSVRCSVGDEEWKRKDDKRKPLAAPRPQDQRGRSHRVSGHGYDYDPQAPSQTSAPSQASAPRVRHPVDQLAARANYGEGTPIRFEVILDKTDGKRLGMYAVGEDDPTLLIERVKGGLVGAWNENSSQKVRRGDWIVGVNGVDDDAYRLVDECQQNKILKMKIERGVGVTRETRRPLEVMDRMYLDDVESDASPDDSGTHLSQSLDTDGESKQAVLASLPPRRKHRCACEVSQAPEEVEEVDPGDECDEFGWPY